MKLSESLRDQLKVPLGTLVLDSKVTKDHIMRYLNDSPLITVGDRTTQKMIEFGFVPDLQIVDGVERRKKIGYPDLPESTVEIIVENPPAHVTQQSIESIKKAFEMTVPVRLTVCGEEDLLVLPVCVYAPADSIVMYGQPNEGLVIVQITPEIRNKTRSILDLMK